MAGSRLEKIGTIYTRTTGLIKSGALRWEDRPIWYDIYEAFPPKEEPRFDRPAPKIPLRKIFYKEDEIRALFHRHNKQIGTNNLRDDKFKSLTQRFVECYQRIEKQYPEGQTNQEQLYKEAIDLLKKERDSKHVEVQLREEVPEEEEISLSSAFKAAQDTRTHPSPSLNVKVSDIFKD